MSTNLLIAMRDFGEQQKQVVMTQLEKNGAVIDKCYLAYTKMGIFQELQKHPDINVVLVSEFLEERSPYTPKDLNEIDELKEDLKVIPILMDEHVGTDYMVSLYASAIYDALFEQDGSYDKVAGIIQRGRGKKAARNYYNIEETVPVNEKTSSNPDSIYAGVRHIVSGGPKEEIVNRAEYVYERISTGEFRAVLEKLPEEIIEIVKKEKKFREFFLMDEVSPEQEKINTHKIPMEKPEKEPVKDEVEKKEKVYLFLDKIKYVIPLFLALLGIVLMI